MASNLKLFKHQQVSVDFLTNNEKVADFSDPGTGKTGVEIIAYAKRPKRKAALVIAPKSLLQAAWENDFRKFAPNIKCSVAFAHNRKKAMNAPADVYITNHDAVKDLLTYPASYWKKFDTLIVDECFPAGTPIDTPFGQRAIETLKCGDLINTSSGPLPISKTFQNKSNALVHIELETGETIECTENHPFATTNGWVEARSTRGLSVVRLNVHQHNEPRSTILQPLMWTQSTVGIEITGRAQHNRAEISPETERFTELEQGHTLPPRNQNQTQRESQGDGAQTKDSRWKRTYRTLRKNDARNALRRLVASTCHQYWEKTRQWISTCVQSRFCKSIENESTGNRRQFAHIAQILGCEERFIVDLTRVVRVSRIERTSETVVFNLQVDGPHTYSVKGVLVHNCTAFKNHTSQRSKALAKLAKHFKYRRIMSGTPTSNGICDLWHQIYILDEGKRLGKSFTGFRNAVCVPEQVGPMPNMVKWIDKEGIEEKIYLLLHDIVIRHKFEECVDIPPNHTYSLSYELPKKHMAHYTELQDSSLLLINESSISAINGAVLYTKLLQAASGAAYDDYGNYTVLDTGRYELVMDLVEERDHSVVFFNWGHQKSELTRIAEARKIPYAVIDGKTPVQEREQITKHYQSGFYRVLFAHPQSAGHGLTLTRGRTTIWASPTYNLEHFQQGNRRIYRISQTQKTETIVIVAPGTVDERVYKALQGKQVRMDALLKELQCSPL